MCLIVDSKNVQKALIFPKKEGVKTMLAYKVYLVDEWQTRNSKDTLFLRYRYQNGGGFKAKKGLVVESDRAVKYGSNYKTRLTDHESRWLAISHGIHVFSCLETARECAKNGVSNYASSAVILRVRCHVDDFIAVGGGKDIAFDKITFVGITEILGRPVGKSVKPTIIKARFLK